MNKTISIHLCGILFNLEEGGYEKLANYLRKIKSYFQQSEGSEEIMEDIEARLAEIFTGKIVGHKQVITEKEVEEAMNIIGKPEDFATGSESEPQNTYSYYEQSNNQEKKLFRDTEYGKLGGVCEGLGYYFGIDPVWIRLAFAIAFFVFGSGFLLYIILWIVIPEAKTTADKLRMKGMPVNLENIEQKFKENLKKFGEKVEGFAKNAEYEFKSGQAGNRINKVGNQLGNSLVELIQIIVGFLGKVLGFALLISSIGLFIAVMILLFTSNSFGGLDGSDFLSHRKLLGLIFENSLEMNLFYLGLVILLITPIIWLLLGGLRMLVVERNKFRIPLTANAIAFTVGVILIFFSIITLTQSFDEKVVKTENITLSKVQLDSLEVDFPTNISEKSIKNVQVGNYFFFVNEEDLTLYSRTLFTIEPTSSTDFALNLKKSSYGPNNEDARQNLNDFNIKFSQEGNKLSFDRFFGLKSASKWRNQQAHITLMMPVGKTIKINGNAENNLHRIDNQDETSDYDMAGHYWKMEEKGLKCLDCTN